MYHKVKEVASICLEKFTDFLETEEKSLFYWVPVCYGIGIAFYFSLNKEPLLNHALSALVITSCIYAYLRFKKYHWQSKFALGLFLIALGFSAIKMRTDYLKTPMLVGEIGFQTLDGTLKSIERLPSYTRVIIENVHFKRQLRQDLPIPTKVRVSLRGRLQPNLTFFPGNLVRVKASLRPPSHPVAPGAYDFRRRAYFEGIGGVGYGITPLTHLNTDHQQLGFTDKIRHKITHWRTQLTNYIRTHIKGQSGAVVSALVTGDRSAIKNNTRQAFADAGIAHILAISGLHLSIVAGLIFFLIRGILSLIPTIALRYNTKKLAAAIALIFTFSYLILSGAPIPAKRAFIMTSLILIAVMTDRVAFTLRNVALAAFIVLIISPESLVGPSFQLSFAAVIGLVVAYEKMHPFITKWYAQAGESRFPALKKLSLYLYSLIFSSFIATIATAPFTIFTFNRFSLVAILTNLIAIPYVTFVVMPLIVFSLFTAPLTMHFMGPILENILNILNTLAFDAQQLPGAVILVPQVGVIIKATFISGLLWLALWNTKKRFLGFIPLVISIFIFSFNRQPDIYITQEQNLIGYYNQMEQKAWVNTLRSGRFARKAWLQLIASPNVSKLSDKNTCDYYHNPKEGCYTIKKGTKKLYFTQSHQTKWRKKIYNLEVKASENNIMVPLLSTKDFKYKGAHFIWIDSDKIRLQNVRDVSGFRPWNYFKAP